MSTAKKRFARERSTIEAMIALFCRDQHQSTDRLCAECAALAEYAGHRLDKCPYDDGEKPTCAQCPIHCYKPDRREQVRTVMRYAGPRLLLRRPILALRHKLDERKAVPERPRGGRRRAAGSSDQG